MTREELKQKLEAIRNKEQFGKWSYSFQAGADLFLPLLLDAYEALENIKEKLNGTQTIHMTIPSISKLTDAEIKLVQFSYQDSNEALARIEAFANGEALNERRK